MKGTELVPLADVVRPGVPDDFVEAINELIMSRPDLAGMNICERTCAFAGMLAQHVVMLDPADRIAGRKMILDFLDSFIFQFALRKAQGTQPAVVGHA